MYIIGRNDSTGNFTMRCGICGRRISSGMTVNGILVCDWCNPHISKGRKIDINVEISEKEKNPEKDE